MKKKPLLRNFACWLMLLSFIMLNINIPVFASGGTSSSISMGKSTLGINDTIKVTISNGSADSGAWVGLYNKDDIPGSGTPSIWWKYLSDFGIQSGNGEFNFDLSTIANVQGGKTYKLVLFRDGNYNVDASVEFNISGITIANTSLGIKDATKATITNGSSDTDAWVGLYNKDDVPSSATPSMWWKYLSDLGIQNGNGEFNFDLSAISKVEEGKNCKIVLFKNGGYTVDASVEFKILAPPVPEYSLQSTQLNTKVGVAPQLPSTVKKSNIDGSTTEVNVTWDAIDTYKYAKASSFTVEGTVNGLPEKAKADVTVVEGDGPEYSFQILSDTHLISDLSSVHDVNFDNALKDINKVDPNSSRIIINGDTTDTGLKVNWEAFKTIVNSNTHPKIDAALGNHDTWQENYWSDDSRYATAKQNYLDYTGEPNIYYDYWLKENHFIFLGSEKPNGNFAYFSDTQLKWFDETLAKNAASNKPIFVFIHQPLYDTVSGSKPGQGWNGITQDAQVKAILAKYPQAVLFTGHTHWEFGSKFTSYNEKYCTMFNIPSSAYCWTDEDKQDDISEGYYVDVYKDKLVIKGRNFTTREWMENAQYEVAYQGTAKNATIKVSDYFANKQSTTPQLNNLTLTSDKDSLILNGIDKAKLALNGTMTNGNAADLSKATIQYTSDNSNVANVDGKGVVTQVGPGLANITARATIGGITESSTLQIQVVKIKTIATLKGITLDGAALETFADDTLGYNVTLSANSTKVPMVAATATDSEETVVVKQATSVQDPASIAVTSADGTVTKIYLIKFVMGNAIVDKVNAPIFSLDTKTSYFKAQKLSISSATEGARIRYTTDGTDPNTKSQVYAGPITLDSNTTVRAIAVKEGSKDSELASATYTINIATGTEIIKNGDFSNGITDWITYNDNVAVSTSEIANGEFKNTIVNVGGYAYSIELGQGDFKLSAGSKYRLTFDAKSTVNRNIKPVIEQDEGSYTRYLDQTAALTSEMKTYSYDFTMAADENVAHLAFDLGNIDGALATHDLFIDNVSLKEVHDAIAQPNFSIERGTYSTTQTVAISSATEGTTIRYTLDGSDPTINSTVYSTPITVAANTIIKAYATKAGLLDSKIYGVTYKFAPVAEPIFSISSGTYTTTQTVAISSYTEAAIIRYTTDGTTPTVNSPVYSEPIAVNATTTIKAYAVKAGHTDSGLVSAVYTVNKPSGSETNDNGTSAGGNTIPTTTPANTNGNENGTISVEDITQNPVVSKDKINSIKGQDKSIIFKANGVTWTFNGKDIISDLTGDIDLSLRTVSDALKAREELKVRSILGKTVPMFSFSFNYDGKLPGKTNVGIFAGTPWANKDIAVCRYYPDKNTYETIANSHVDKEGYFSFTTDHCSDYFIIETNNTLKLPQTGSPIDTAVLLEIGALLVVIGLIVITTYCRKQNKHNC